MTNRVAVGTGMYVTIHDKAGAGWPQEADGEHEWAFSALWRVADPTAEALILDTENLITLAGPGCIHCEQAYTDELAATPCRGEE